MKNQNSITKTIFLVFCIFLSISLNARDVSVKEIQIATETFTNSSFWANSLDSISELKDSKNQLIGFVAVLKPNGYIVFSNNTDIYPIISYSKSSSFYNNDSTNNILLHLVSWDLESRNNSLRLKSASIASIVTENNLVWDKYLSGENLQLKSTEEVYGPLLGTMNWYQSGFYNQYCPIDPEGNRSVVGCVATAASQIINYWKYPKKINFDFEADHYTSKGKHGNILIPEDANSYDFPTFSVLEDNLASIKYDGSESEIAYLCFGIGIKHEMNYSSSASGTYQSDEVYRNLGFGSANIDEWSNCYNKVISNIKDGWPVQVSIHNYTLDNHHSVVFDGYNSSNKSFHVNMGWSGTDEDTWYIPPTLDTPYQFNSMGWAVYNVSPYQGWSQYAADQKNSRRTIYPIPTSVKDKWNFSGMGDYHFQGLVVGNSSKIISTWSPRALNQNNFSDVYIIPEDGDLKKTIGITLPYEDRHVSHPAQSNDGRIYVATSYGNIYFIDQEKLTATKIFSDPKGEAFEMGDIKIDKEGNLYVATDYTFYCLSSIGTKKWSVPAPSNCWYVRGTPAIDDSKNKVYNSYYNTSEKKSYFIVIDKNTGTVLDKKEFIDIPTASRHLGIPSIGQNGKVYFGKRTKLYELNVDNNYSYTEVFDNEWSTISESPAIGEDGTIYIPYWIDDTHQVVGAINPVSKTKKWEISFELTDYDNIREIYVDKNNIVCFTIQKENGSNSDTYTLYAYKDNGSSYTKLWEKNFNTDGGFTAFGPNKTIYVSNNNLLTAIAEPEENETFPNYTNNSSPASPTYLFPDNGSADLDTSLTFSWTCNDPDGNNLKYSFYFGTGEMLDIYQSDITANSIKIDGLSGDTYYQWSVAATDGQSVTYGPVWTFKTQKKITLPLKPINPLPVNDSLNAPLNVALSWENGGGATSYKVYFGTDSTPDESEYKGSQSSTNFNPGSLTYNTNFYWRVDAVNSDGTTTGDVWHFTTGAEPISAPSKPTNPSPENRATAQSIDVDLSWSNGGGAISYNVYFGTDPTPASGELQGNQSGTIFNLGKLNYNTTYYWRIDAINSAGTTAGDVWHFTTEAESNNQDELVWEDGFEDYTPGTFPSNWVADANATNLSKNFVNNNVKKEGENSLQLFGSLGACWGALAYRSISVSPPYYISFDVKNGTEQLSGCHPDRASIALRKGTSWSNPARSLVDFKNDGKIYANGSDLLDSYSTDTWINVIIKYELAESNQVKTTFWVNNNFKGEYYSSTIADENGLNNLQLAVQEGTAWFDNVKIYKSLSIPTGFNSYVYENNIRIYPNPVKDQITISVDDPDLINSEVKIINSLGSVVSVYKLDSYETKINTSSLLSGFYIIQIQNGNFIYNEKITK